MNNLTKREKLLVTVGLSLVVVFLAFNYLIQPAFNTYTEKTDLYTQLQFDRDLTVNKIAGEQNVMTIYNNTLENYSELAKMYPDEMSNQELDKLITGICLQHNLKPTSLGISSKSSGNDEQASAISNVAIRVSVNAGFSDLQRFINTINNTTYIQISNFSYSARDGAVDVDMDFNVQMLRG